MSLQDHEMKLMSYIDGEMSLPEREEFERHIATCDSCRSMVEDMSALKEVTDTMKLADLPEAAWEKYWSSVYNQLERSVAWFLFIVGAVILLSYSIYKVITEPGMNSIVSLGVYLSLIGFAILFLSVLREKLNVNKKDRYISEVER